MDNQTMHIILQIIAEAFVVLTWFGCGWFVVYAIVGPWLKGRLIRWRSARKGPAHLRSGPVYVSHIVFSVAFVNPYTLLAVVLRLKGIIDSPILEAILFGSYLILLPMMYEYILLRVMPRWHRLRWLNWPAPLKRAVPCSLLISILGLCGGYAAVQIREMACAVGQCFVAVL